MAQSRELGAGAWSYFGDPRAISHDGHTFTGWISTVGHVWVARLTKGGKLSKRLIFRGLGRDDHNNPSLVFLPDGRIVAFFSPHSGRFLPPAGIPSVMRYRISEHPYSIDELGAGAHRPDERRRRARLHLPEPDAAARQAVAVLARRRLEPDVLLHREQDRLGPGARARALGRGPAARTRSTSATARRTSTGSSPTGTSTTSTTASTTSATRTTTSSTATAGGSRGSPSVPIRAAEPRPRLQVLRQRRPGVAARHRADVRRAGRGSSTRAGSAAAAATTPSGTPTTTARSGSAARSSRRARAGSRSPRAARRSTTRTRASSTCRGRSAVEPGRAVVHPRQRPHVDRPSASPTSPTTTRSGPSRRAACAARTGSCSRRATRRRRATRTTARASTRSISEGCAGLARAESGTTPCRNCRRAAAFRAACARCSPDWLVACARRSFGRRGAGARTLVATPRFVPAAGPLLAGPDRRRAGSRAATTRCSTCGSPSRGSGPRRVQRFSGADSERLRSPRLTASPRRSGLELRVTDLRGQPLAHAHLRRAAVRRAAAPGRATRSRRAGASRPGQAAPGERAAARARRSGRGERRGPALGDLRASPSCALRLRSPLRLRGDRLRLGISCAGLSHRLLRRDVVVRAGGRVIARGPARYNHTTPPYAAAALRSRPRGRAAAAPGRRPCA